MNLDRRSYAKCEFCDAVFKYRPSASRGRFCSNKCQGSFVVAARDRRIEETGNLESIAIARKWLIARGRVCSICKLTEWQEEPIPLVCDHINGNSSDWSVSNMRLICCNCDALTPFYKNKNKGNGRFARRQRYHEGLSS